MTPSTRMRLSLHRHSRDSGMMPSTPTGLSLHRHSREGGNPYGRTEHECVRPAVGPAGNRSGPVQVNGGDRVREMRRIRVRVNHDVAIRVFPAQGMRTDTEGARPAGSGRNGLWRKDITRFNAPLIHALHALHARYHPHGRRSREGRRIAQSARGSAVPAFRDGRTGG